MFAWPYFDEIDGYLFDENGTRVRFDGSRRDAHEWEQYLIAHDIRGSVR